VREFAEQQPRRSNYAAAHGRGKCLRGAWRQELQQLIALATHQLLLLRKKSLRLRPPNRAVSVVGVAGHVVISAVERESVRSGVTVFAQDRAGGVVLWLGGACGGPASSMSISGWIDGAQCACPPRHVVAQGS